MNKGTITVYYKEIAELYTYTVCHSRLYVRLLILSS